MSTLHEQHNEAGEGGCYKCKHFTCFKDTVKQCSNVSLNFDQMLCRSEKPNTLSLWLMYMFSLKTKGRASANDHYRLEWPYRLKKEKLLDSLNSKLLLLIYNIFYLFGLKNKERAGEFYQLAVIL